MEREKYEAIIENVIWLQKYLRFQVLNKIQNSAVVSGDTFQEIVDRYFEFQRLEPFLDEKIASEVDNIYMLSQKSINDILDILRQFLRVKKLEDVDEREWVEKINNQWRSYVQDIDKRIDYLMDQIKKIISSTPIDIDGINLNIRDLVIRDGSIVQIGQDNKNITNNINSENFIQALKMLTENKTKKQQSDIIKKIREYADNGLAIGELVKKFIALLS